MEHRRPAVLVVDDETHVREVLEVGLGQRGFAVTSAPDGLVALRLLRETAFDVILLDLMMPKVDGLALLPMVRRSTEAPVVMLSAKGDVESRVSGLEAGADDYVPKPFDFDELAARLRAALRRPTLAEVTVMSYDDLVVDLARRRVERGGQVIHLSTREFDLLAALARSPERVFTRAQLLDLVWGPMRDVSQTTVETYISYLRAKIDRAPRRPLIHTVRGVGYCIR